MAWIKAYKRFNKDLTCKGHQYNEGLNEDPEWENPIICERGVHACENPLDCNSYYAPADSVIRECEMDATEETREDSKRVGRAIKIGAELDVMGLCKAHFEYVTSRCDKAAGRVGGDREAVSVGEKASAAAGESGSAAAGNWGSAAAGESGSAAAGESGSAAAGESGSAAAGESGSAAAGESGSAAAGNWGSAAAGNWGSAAAGNWGIAAAGHKGSAAAGYKGIAAAGIWGSAAAGNWGIAAAGESGSAAAGNWGSAVSRGSASVGVNGLACVRGNGVKVRGGMGAVLVIAEENENDYNIAAWIAAVVDGENIKPDTWYKLMNDEFVEVE